YILTFDQERKTSALSSSSWCDEPLEINDNDPTIEEIEPAEEIITKEEEEVETNSASDLQFIQHRIRHLVEAFSFRTQKARQRIEQSATPSSISSHESVLVVTPKSEASVQQSTMDFDDDFDRPSLMSPYFDGNCFQKIKFYIEFKVIHPQTTSYVVWMCIAALAVIYNVWVIPLRSSFPYQTPDNRAVWMFFDYLADFVYLIDIILVQPRIMYICDGFWVSDIKMTKRNYIRKVDFKLDLISLLPLDLLYFYFGPELVILRLPRFLKVNTFWKCIELIDKIIHSPHIIRIKKILMYMMYLIHLNACAYYAFSAWEGIGSNSFVYNGKGNAYIVCFYFATKTATSIGKNPKPTQEIEYIFMTFSWLMGVFVFALLIGQIRDIIATATRQQSDFKKLEDETLEYMRRQNLPQETLRRVQLWFNYTWLTQRTLEENTILDCLPHKMKTDTAKNVHFKTLSKVSLFKDCDEGLLHELVLQLKSMIYLPGDIICKKGDVGNEMYIVKSGQVQVIGRTDDEILATLSEGSVFGEISLLGIKGMNRRTADVRSRGYSNLFVLSKIDLNNALTHYPEAQELLNKKAKQLMKQNEALERKNKAMIVINNPTPPNPEPKLLETVLQLVPRDSETHRLLRYGSKIRARNPENDKFKVRYSLPITTECVEIKNNGEVNSKSDEKSGKLLSRHSIAQPVVR
ncbi:cyclic nucleotide-gated cation channel beta-1, partial [Agrilus planipennis]|uniref:Cyclic nucleotide-gated cation channel beta-1 n=1 Tax=Agrilus planipennis TaxID=224129 RepID=A0A7F5R2I1_AGRPL